MSEAVKTVHVPLINPNETEARLVGLPIANGAKVAKGDTLATLETTKSTFELLADTDGFVAGLQAKQGDMLPAGQVLLYLAPSKDWQAPKTKLETPTGVPEGLRITQPALQLAHKRGIELNALPIGPIITEDYIAKLASQTGQAAFAIPDSAKLPNSVIVYGGGGHGKAVIDLLRAAGGYALTGIIDDSRQPGDRVLPSEAGYDAAVIGGEAALSALHAAGCTRALNAVGGIGAMSTRIAVFDRLEAAGFELPTLVHPSAVIEPSAQLGAGVQVFPHAYVGSDARVGKGVIINTGVIVSHDCVLEDYANLAPGSILAGSVQVGRGTLIGMGVTINLNVHIGNLARIGNGATVKDSVPDNGVVRAGAVWPS